MWTDPSCVAIRDCIEQRGVTERFAGSAAFVSFLFEQELAFVRTGRGRMQRELYVRKFGPVEAEGCFIRWDVTQSLREWGHRMIGICQGWTQSSESSRLSGGVGFSGVTLRSPSVFVNQVARSTSHVTRHPCARNRVAPPYRPKGTVAEDSVWVFRPAGLAKQRYGRIRNFPGNSQQTPSRSPQQARTGGPLVTPHSGHG